MKMKVNVRNLRDVVGMVGKACNSKSISNMSNQVMFTVEANKLTLLGNDTSRHFAITTSIEVEADENFEVILDCSMLQSILSKLNDASDVTFDFSGTSNVIIRSEKSRFTLNMMNAETYPRLPKMEITSTMTINGGKLKDAINNTSFALAASSTQTLRCENIKKIGDKVIFTATDGHKVARNSISGVSGADMDIVIEGQMLKIASSIINPDTEYTLSISNVFVILKSDDTTLVMQRSDETYPNVDTLLTNVAFNKFVTINKSDFQSAIDRTTLFLVEGDNKPVIIDAKKTSMNLSMKSSRGETSEDLDSTLEGDPIKIAFNPRYLMEVLKCIKDATIKIELENPKAPVIIRNDDYCYAILPVNIGN